MEPKPGVTEVVSRVQSRQRKLAGVASGGLALLLAVIMAATMAFESSGGPFGSPHSRAAKPDRRAGRRPSQILAIRLASYGPRPSTGSYLAAMLLLGRYRPAHGQDTASGAGGKKGAHRSASQSTRPSPVPSPEPQPGSGVPPRAPLPTSPRVPPLPCLAPLPKLPKLPRLPRLPRVPDPPRVPKVPRPPELGKLSELPKLPRLPKLPSLEQPAHPKGGLVAFI
jgi:hypothetical protein